MHESDGSDEMREAILEVVDNQVRDNDPPETRQTIARLVAEGHSEEESRRLVGMAVAVEVFHIMKEKQPFNRERYLRNLRHLPLPPWEDGPDEGSAFPG